jgi:hypothetical protein
VVVDDLDDHLARLHRADQFGADRAFAHLVNEGFYDIERDVGLQQRTANLAQRRVHVGGRKRTAAGDLVENAAQAI